jgi:hypothetical protein
MSGKDSMEPRAYFDPPSEREMTASEIEQFLARQDAAWTGLFNEATWINGTPIEEVGITITRITPPAQGWPIAMHCPICKETTFVLSQWDIKPERADYFKMLETCGSKEFGDRHNMKLACDRTWLDRFRNPPLNPYAILGDER